MTNQSIYEKVLGTTFRNMHPKLQKRYRIVEGDVLTAKGEMKQIVGGPKWLYPLWLLGTLCKLVFPERGENIPFTITNRAYRAADGLEEVHWERAFQFPRKTRYFNAVMSYDPKRQIIKDYLGEPSPLYSDLKLTVHADGSLEMVSVKQRLVIGKLEIPLPKLFHGVARVRESYDEQSEHYRISVHVANKIIGDVFSYEGVFQIDEKA